MFRIEKRVIRFGFFSDHPNRFTTEKRCGRYRFTSVYRSLRRCGKQIYGARQGTAFQCCNRFSYLCFIFHRDEAGYLCFHIVLLFIRAYF